MKTQKEGIFKMDSMNYHLFEHRQSQCSEELTTCLLFIQLWLTIYYVGNPLLSAMSCHEVMRPGSFDHKQHPTLWVKTKIYTRMLPPVDQNYFVPWDHSVSSSRMGWKLRWEGLRAHEVELGVECTFVYGYLTILRAFIKRMAFPHWLCLGPISLPMPHSSICEPKAHCSVMETFIVKPQTP